MCEEELSGIRAATRNRVLVNEVLDLDVGTRENKMAILPQKLITGVKIRQRLLNLRHRTPTGQFTHRLSGVQPSADFPSHFNDRQTIPSAYRALPNRHHAPA